MTEFVIVSVQLPRSLADWLDQLVITRRTALLDGAHDDATLPTRSSILREVLLRAKNI